MEDYQEKVKYYDPSKKMALYYPIIKQYLYRKILKQSIWEDLEYLKGKNVVLYAITELTDFIIEDIQNAEYQFKISYIVDIGKAGKIEKYKQIPVYGVKKMIHDFDSGQVDFVIVCSVRYENEIIDMLEAESIHEEKIVPLLDIIM